MSLHALVRRDWLGSEGFRYLLATGLSAALTISLPYLFHEILDLSAEVAVALSYTIVFVVNFVSVKIFVFRNFRGHISQLIKFAALSAIMRGSEYAAFYLMHTLLGWNYLLIVIFVMSCSFVLKFMVQRHFVFS